MAQDQRLTLRNEQKVVKLAKSTTKTYKYYADQLVEKLGTARKSEIRGKIGNTGKSWKELMLDYLSSL